LKRRGDWEVFDFTVVIRIHFHEDGFNVGVRNAKIREACGELLDGE